MNVLFIVDKYFPVPTSNSVCAKRVSLQFENSYVLSISDTLDNVDGSNYSYYYKRQPSSYLSRVFGFCEDKNLVTFLEHKAQLLIDMFDIDTIICVYQPVENILVGMRLKKKYRHIKIISFMLDCIGEYDYLHFVKYKLFYYNLVRLLKKFEKLCDGFISLKYYSDVLNACKLKKVEYVGIPNLINNQYNNVLIKNELIYLGSFNKDFRDPTNFLQLISQTDIKMHLYSMGCDSIVERYVAQNSRLIKHDLVLSSEASRLANDGYFLVNISNTLKHAVPGKLVEYFSSGCPIISYFFKKSDPAIKECESYPDMLILYDGDSNNLDKLLDFLRMEHKIISFDKLKEVYYDCTPAYVAEKILKLCNS